MTEPATADGSGSELLDLNELVERVGMSVRNVRFYTSRGLVPPPIRRGRSGFYTADHVARLELVRELQSHGFTLAAIQGYLARIPADATAADIAAHLALLAPVDSDGRQVDVERGLVGLGVPDAAAEAVAEVYERHGQQVADELSEIVRALVWPEFRARGGDADQLRELVHRLKPLTVAGLVTAYEQAMDASAASYVAKGRAPDA